MVGAITVLSALVHRHLIQFIDHGISTLKLSGILHNIFEYLEEFS